MTSFIAIFALLRWSGTEPVISPRYACISVCLVLSVSYVFVQPRLPVVKRITKLILLLLGKVGRCPVKSEF